MIERTIKLLTSQSRPFSTCVMGNEGIARAALEAGVNGVFAYPGTPSTEISEIFNHVSNFQNSPEQREKYPEFTSDPVYFEYSINEKIALEKAIAFSIGNRSALCIMKNVGMNVASDALMSVTYQAIGAPLVIIVCDDPGCHSSSNEQDSRFWGLMASVPVFNPATPKDAFEMVKMAFGLSASISLPVIIRTTTRVSHSRSVVTYGAINSGKRTAGFSPIPEYINIPARTAAAHNRLLAKLKSDSVLAVSADCTRFIKGDLNTGLGIITSGVSYAYTLEILGQNNILGKADILDIGLIHPFPDQQVLEFLQNKYSKILVLEELEPFVENAVRIIVQRHHLPTEIKGKGFAGLAETGEFSIDLLQTVFEHFFDIKFIKNVPLDNQGGFLDKLPPRPPVLCAGCPHRATFYLLKLAIPRDTEEFIMCGDIGCFGLGALPPLKMIDTINHMGMSISMAQGLYESLHGSGRNKKVVALLGDGTFFHSGLASLVNAVYTRANILVIIFDNRTIGMTGHQSHPGAARQARYHEIDIPPLLKGMGIAFVETFDPFHIPEAFEKVHKAVAHQGVSVLISKAPCIFLSPDKGKSGKKSRIVVDEHLCNTCANHEDISLSCSRCYAPKNNISRARAKLIAPVSVAGTEELCPANICNHGFFHSILEGDYKSALEIVRDKMLFARTCGDICHRPCELFCGAEDKAPIKKLKNFVSNIDDHFRDFSVPIKRAAEALPKIKNVAIVGAGPAGLSAAYDLVQFGYGVTVFEKESRAGGMVYFVIPSFRMDKSGFDYEISQLEQMGVRFRYNTVLGIDISIEQLSGDYDAVLLAIGLNKARVLDLVETRIPINLRTDALTFLRAFNADERILYRPSVILVVGGGNSAIDAARAAKKSNPEHRVVLSCIEKKDKMPAFAEEIDHAVHEGVEIIPDSYIHSCNLTGDKVNVALYRHEHNRMLQDVECDFVITAIGQTVETGIVAPFDTDNSYRVRSENSFTGYRNVFVAGDISSGNHMSVIGAIASGKKAVTGIRKLLEDYPYNYEGEIALARLNSGIPPVSIHHATGEPEDDEGLPEIEQYNLFQSCRKCNHCIDNFGCPAMVKVNGKIQIDESRCNRCGLCIDVCPNNAIRWERIMEEDTEAVESL